MLKNDLIDEVAYANLAGDMYAEIVARVYTAYQELRQSEAMDFDDFDYADDTARPESNAPDLLPATLLVHFMWTVSRYQPCPIPAGQALGFRFKNITVVGSADQSIYVAGDDMQNLLDFEKLS